MIEYLMHATIMQFQEDAHAHWILDIEVEHLRIALSSIAEAETTGRWSTVKIAISRVFCYMKWK
jgi:acyl-ACP thioesterase